MSRQGLTRKQKELFDFIESYMASHDNVAPSFEEMMKALGLKSKSGVHRMITALVDRGWLYQRPHRARCLTIIPDADSKISDVLGPYDTARVSMLAAKEKCSEHEVIQRALDGYWIQHA